MEIRRHQVCAAAGGNAGPLLAWFVLLALGLAIMAGYAYSPGATLATEADWPKGMTFAPARNQPTLVVGLHPRCTCSVATVRELERIVAGAGLRPQIEILLYRPAGPATGWDRSAFDEELKRIPGVTVREDVNGIRSRAFGMLTSGDVALFTPGGRRLFRGGVTSARGHEGESAGGRQLSLALSEGNEALGATPPVFGCPLRSPG